ncbi:hypothetical protein [Streptomyces griseorubiginosus]|uniref:hypothetical protein n=1 Tax=Streptomyces griseorubiginosus TaxID=67304 RepID=UPI0036E1130A
MTVSMPKVFFADVREAYTELAERLGLEGPVETEQVLPVSTYTRGAVGYRIYLDMSEGGSLRTAAGLRTPDIWFTVGIEKLAIAAGVVDKRGTVSYSARNLKQMKKSLVGQRAFVEPLHPLLCDDPESAVRLLRRAGAREWSLRPEE